MSPDSLTLEWACLVISIPLLFAAWNEYAARNMRDSKLLACFGIGGLVLSSFGFVF